MRKFTKTITIPLATMLLLAAALFIFRNKGEKKMISEFGRYEGYSQAVYDGTKRISEYLTLTDGTRLAYDVIIPTHKGQPADTPLPALFKYTPYGRTWTVFDKEGKFLLGDFEDLDWVSRAMLHVRHWLVKGDQGRILDPLFRDRWLGELVKHGYVIVSVDRPGTGASFSSRTPGSMETAAKYENEIIDWIAAQPWSDGSVGMYGDSQQAMVQFAAASAGNPHLKAILPAASDIEIYQSVDYPGGVYNKAFESVYAMVPFLDRLSTPVDSDPDGVILAQALAERRDHSAAQATIEMGRECKFRDSTTPGGVNPWDTMALYPFIDRINRSGTPVYMTVGWYDIFTADMFYWFNNLNVPRRLTVRPTDHNGVSTNQADLNYGVEALRWFDYWLKSIDNGIMEEAPIHYYLQERRAGGGWLTAGRWPLAGHQMTAFYFGPGKTGSVESANDGGLINDLPAIVDAADTYTVDYTTTTGTRSRWSAVEAAHAYPNMRSNDAKGLTYTTPVLKSDLILTGHPVVHLWLASDAPDADVFVYLEAVDSTGRSTYITEGNLRASHRKLARAPFDNLGLPYQSHFQTDQEWLRPGEPAELVFSLLPTAYQVHPGERLRITITFADAGNFDTPVLDPAPVMRIFRSSSHPSYIELPEVKP